MKKKEQRRPVSQRAKVAKNVKIAKKVHCLDERAKALHKSVHQFHQHAKEFREDSRSSNRKAEKSGGDLRPGSGLTEQDLKKSADEQLYQMALLGSRNRNSKTKKSA